MMTQKDMVIDFIKENGSITTWQAITELGITRLASRIADIEREGHEIQRERVTRKNKYGKTTSYTRYWF